MCYERSEEMSVTTAQLTWVASRGVKNEIHSMIMTNIIEQIEEHLMQFRQEPTIKMSFVSDTTDSSNIGSTTSEYKRNWNKLGLAHKINRMMVYFKKLCDDYHLNESQKQQLKQLFYAEAGHIAKDDIVYDSALGTIIKLNHLKQGKDGVFYFEHADHTPKKKVVIAVKKFNPLSLEKLQSASVTDVPTAGSTSNA